MVIEYDLQREQHLKAGFRTAALERWAPQEAELLLGNRTPLIDGREAQL
jgi:hypothetical protein